MRRAFAKAVTNIAISDPAVILIVGDIGWGMFDRLRAERPKQFLNIGIMEQTMVGVAAGMALEGLKPWVFTISPFLFERAFEQIKIDIDANNADVKLIGYADYPEQGTTHANILDFRKHNPFQNIQCLYPKNYEETIDLTFKMYVQPSPILMSLSKDRDYL